MGMDELGHYEEPSSKYVVEESDNANLKENYVE
jgi:hypothetical protein